MKAQPDSNNNANHIPIRQLMLQEECVLFPEWSNDSRMEALFSNFGHEIPVDCLEYWSRAIEWCCFGLACPTNRKTDLSTLTSPSCRLDFAHVSRIFCRKGVTPDRELLKSVFIAMIDEGALIEEKTLIAKTYEWKKTKWVLRQTIQRPLSYLLSNGQGILKPSLNPSTKWISMSLIQSISDIIVSFCRHRIEMDRLFCLPKGSHHACNVTGKSYTLAGLIHEANLDYVQKNGMDSASSPSSKFHSSSESVSPWLLSYYMKEISLEDMHLIAHVLIQTERAVWMDETYIKILVPVTTSSIWQSVSSSLYTNDSFESKDGEVLKILHSIDNMECQLDQYNKEMEVKRQEALNWKRKDQTQRALHAFRLYKSMDKNRTQRENGLYQMHSMIQSLRSMYQNSEMIEVMKFSNQLQSLRENMGLTIEKVEETMDMWQESIDETNEINSMIENISVGSIPQFDEEELEMELAALDKDTVNEKESDSGKKKLSKSLSNPQIQTTKPITPQSQPLLTTYTNQPTNSKVKISPVSNPAISTEENLYIKANAHTSSNKKAPTKPQNKAKPQPKAVWR